MAFFSSEKFATLMVVVSPCILGSGVGISETVGSADLVGAPDGLDVGERVGPAAIVNPEQNPHVTSQ